MSIAPGDLPEAGLLSADLSASARQVALSALVSFSELGFHATTTRHITDCAKLSAGSLYTHYRSKEELLQLWMRVAHQDALAVARAAVARAQAPEDKVAAFVQALTLWHIRYRIVSQLSTTQLRALSQAFYAQIRLLRGQITDLLREQVLACPGMAGKSDALVEALLNAVFAMVLDVARWYRPGAAQPPQDVAGTYATFARALLNAPQLSRP